MPATAFKSFIDRVPKHYLTASGNVIVAKETLFSSMISVNLTDTKWKQSDAYIQSYQDFFAWFLPSKNGTV